MGYLLDKLVNKLASSPSIFILLRRMLELNFIAEKSVMFSETKTLQRGSRVLDIGCGTGEFSPLFLDFEYIGIDLEPRYTNYAKRKYANNFITMDGEQMAFPNDMFDLLVVVGVFHHLDDGKCYRLFQEMRRVVKDGGKIFVMEDVDIESKWDIFGNLLRYLDKGDYIRKEKEYLKLFSKLAPITNYYSVRSGLISYQVFSFVAGNFLPYCHAASTPGKRD